VLVSKWVADIFGREGIHDTLIRLYGYPYLGNREEYKLDPPAEDMMTAANDLVLISASGNTLDSLGIRLVMLQCALIIVLTCSYIAELLEYTDYKGFPVVKSAEEMELIGYIARTELRFAIGKYFSGLFRNIPQSLKLLYLVDNARNTSGNSGSTPCYFGVTFPVTDTPSYVDLRPWMDNVGFNCVFSHNFDRIWTL